MEGLDVRFYEWAFTQGGLTAVVLVLLWSYRRDFVSLLKSQDERLSVLTKLVGDAMGAIHAGTAQSEATEKAMHRLSRAIERALDQRASVRIRDLAEPEDS